MFHESVRVFIPFEWTKSLSMKLPVAPQSRRALTEWSSLVSVVLISTGRSKEVPHVSKTLIKRSLGSLFSHLVLRSGVEIKGVGGSVSTSSLLIVLGVLYSQYSELIYWRLECTYRRPRYTKSFSSGVPNSSTRTASFKANRSSINSSRCSVVS